MTSLQRVLTALSHKEPDRVPLFLPLTMHGAKELGISIREYFSRPDRVVEGQLRLRAKYRCDFHYSFFYAAVEAEAWGGEVIFRDDGPPNAGSPIVRAPQDIERLHPPCVEETPCLLKILEATRLLRREIGNEVPIVGVVMSPFSLPVMQMGFGPYIELILERPALFDRLMAANKTFCVRWANAQLEAGATAICYFDPVSSPTITDRKTYLRTGFEVACETLAKINGPTATHLASGRCLPIVDDLCRTGTAIVGASALEDLAEVKGACKGKLTVLGNLNTVQLRRWSAHEAELAVKDAIARAGRGGGFILSDNHGEIPWQVPDETLLALSQAAETWGTYPLSWVEADAR